MAAAIRMKWSSSSGGRTEQITRGYEARWHAADRAAFFRKACVPPGSRPPDRDEGIPGCRTRLRARSFSSLDACQGRIDVRTLTLLKNRTDVDLEFFNRLDPHGTFALLQTGQSKTEKPSLDGGDKIARERRHVALAVRIAAHEGIRLRPAQRR